MSNEHKGHNVICKDCKLQAIEFIDYTKTLREGKLYLYSTNKCWCILPTRFYCLDCKVDIELEKD